MEHKEPAAGQWLRYVGYAGLALLGVLLLAVLAAIIYFGTKSV